MKIIKPSVEFFGAVPTNYDLAIRFIEMAGRTCYKSEDKITPDSGEKFVRKLIKAGHLAMVEHSNFVIYKEFNVYSDKTNDIIVTAGKYLNTFSINGNIYIGGNLTAWYQRGKEFDWDFSIFDPFLEFYGDLFYPSSGCSYIDSDWKVCPHDEIPKELHRYSAKFICDRGVSHELVRHRPCSFAQESTRYVNYAGKDMEFIEPTDFRWWSERAIKLFEDVCMDSEYMYLELLEEGLKPQQARAALPNALKTEIVVTADAAEWNHIRKLRTSSAAHPDMQRVMSMIPWEKFL